MPGSGSITANSITCADERDATRRVAPITHISTYPVPKPKLAENDNLFSLYRVPRLNQAVSDEALKTLHQSLVQQRLEERVTEDQKCKDIGKKIFALQLKGALNYAIENYGFSTGYVGFHHGKYSTAGLFEKSSKKHKKLRLPSIDL